MSAEFNRRAWATIARANPDKLPEGSIIVVMNGRATLIVDQDGHPSPITALLNGLVR